MPLTHPLEPLSAAEVAASVRLLKTAPAFTSSTRIISIMLKEPPKDLVHGWPGNPATTLAREAAAVLFDNGINTAYDAVVNLTADEVVSVMAAPAG